MFRKLGATSAVVGSAAKSRFGRTGPPKTGDVASDELESQNFGYEPQLPESRGPAAAATAAPHTVAPDPGPESRAESQLLCDDYGVQLHPADGWIVGDAEPGCVGNRTTEVCGQSEMLVTVVTPKATARSIDLALVIDKSYSMTGHKMLAAQNAMKFMIAELRPTDRLAIATFSSAEKVKTVLKLDAMDAKGKRRAHKAVSGITPDGLTDLGAGLVAGTAALNAGIQMATGPGPKAPRTRVVAVLTDGMVTDGPETAEALAGVIRVAMEQGPAVLHAFGFGEHHNSQLLSELAVQFNGHYHFVPTVASSDNDGANVGIELHSHFGHVVGASAMLVAIDAELVVTGPTGATMSVCGHDTPAPKEPDAPAGSDEPNDGADSRTPVGLPGYDGNTLTFKFGSLPGSAVKRVPISIDFGQLPEGVYSFEALLRFRPIDPSNRVDKRAESCKFQTVMPPAYAASPHKRGMGKLKGKLMTAVTATAGSKLSTRGTVVPWVLAELAIAKAKLSMVALMNRVQLPLAKILFHPLTGLILLLFPIPAKALLAKRKSQKEEGQAQPSLLKKASLTAAGIASGSGVGAALEVQKPAVIAAAKQAAKLIEKAVKSIKVELIKRSNVLDVMVTLLLQTVVKLKETAKTGSALGLLRAFHILTVVRGCISSEQCQDPTDPVQLRLASDHERRWFDRAQSFQSANATTQKDSEAAANKAYKLHPDFKNV